MDGTNALHTGEESEPRTPSRPLHVPQSLPPNSTCRAPVCTRTSRGEILPANFAIALAAVFFCIVIGCTIIAIAAIRRADSAAVPEVLREFAMLVSVLLRRRQ